MPVDHYENFPVASILLPKALRHPVEIIYRFARRADDFADEGDVPAAERLAALAAYDAQLERIAASAPPAPEPDGPLFEALGRVMRDHALPASLFHALVSAFRQDVTVARYDDTPMLLDYCRRSANPVGRLMLLLYRQDSERHRAWSDRICTALQWANFWQDVAIDRAKDRVYLPADDRLRFGIDDGALFGDPASLVAMPAWRALMRHQVDRTKTMMNDGAPLAIAAGGRIGIELRFVVQGGLRILEKIERASYDVFFHRPTIGKADAAVLAMRALTMRA